MDKRFYERDVFDHYGLGAADYAFLGAGGVGNSTSSVLCDFICWCFCCPAAEIFISLCGVGSIFVKLYTSHTGGMRAPFYE